MLSDYLSKNGISNMEELIGREVFLILPRQGIKNYAIRRIQYGKQHKWMMCLPENYRVSELGESIFFTKEEAERYQIQLFKDRCAEFKEQYKLNFGVYYTPAENLCFTSMKKFKEKYGTIKNVSDKQFFTNSIHVPVWEKVNPFEKIDIESQLTGYSSAGCITYVELESSVKHNTEALEEIVNYAMDHDIPYFAINVPNDTSKEIAQYADYIVDGEFILEQKDLSLAFRGSKNQHIWEKQFDGTWKDRSDDI